MDDACDDMLAGVLLCQIETAVKVNFALHNRAHFQRAVAQVDDFLALFPDIQHIDRPGGYTGQQCQDHQHHQKPGVFSGFILLCGIILRIGIIPGRFPVIARIFVHGHTSLSGVSYLTIGRVKEKVVRSCSLVTLISSP